MKTVTGLQVPSPRFDAPWADWLGGTVGFVLATILALLVIIMIMGAGYWIWGKLSGGQSAQSQGLTGFILATGAAAVITVAGSAVVWATDLGPDWASFGGGGGDGGHSGCAAFDPSTGECAD